MKAAALLRRISPGRIFQWRWMRRDWDRRARKNAQHFISCSHAETEKEFWASGQNELESLVLHNVTLAPQARVAEIGCGVGRLLRPLAKLAREVSGVDISVEMIERARVALADLPNVSVSATRGRLDSFGRASLDFVFSFIVFQHIPSKEAVARYIREAGRVLKGQGVFRFQVDGRSRRKLSRMDTWLGVWYEPAEISRELVKAGFEPPSLWGEHTHYLWVTALRRSEAGRPETEAVKLRRREWRRDAVDALLQRMGHTPAEAATVISGEKSLRQLAEGFLARQEGASPEDFVRRAYEVFLGREADQGGLAFYTKQTAGGIPHSNTVDCLLSSSEMEELLRPEAPAPLS